MYLSSAFIPLMGQYVAPPTPAPVLPYTGNLKLFTIASFGVVLGSGTEVSRWNDLSGNNNHLEPFDISDSKTHKINAILNSEPGIRWSGIEQLVSINPISMGSTKKVTVYLVISDDVFTNQTFLFDYGFPDWNSVTDGFAAERGLVTGAPYIFGEKNGPAGNSVSNLGYGPISGCPMLLEILFDNTGGTDEIAMNIYKTGGSIGTGSTSPGNTNDFGDYRLYLGAKPTGVNFDGDIGSIAVYGERLSNPHRTAVINWFKTRYSIV